MAKTNESDEAILSEGVRKLLTGPWPEDRDERLEAKLDAVLGNHLPHVEMRMSRMERAQRSKRMWDFISGLTTLSAVLYLILK